MQTLQSKERKMNLSYYSSSLYRPIILKVCSNVRKEINSEPQSEGAEFLDHQVDKFLKGASISGA